MPAIWLSSTSNNSRARSIPRGREISPFFLLSGKSARFQLAVETDPGIGRNHGPSKNQHGDQNGKLHTNLSIAKRPASISPLTPIASYERGGGSFHHLG